MKKRNNQKIFMCSSVHVWSDTRIYFKEAKSLAKNGFEVEFYGVEHTGKKENVPHLSMHYLPSLPRKKRFRHIKTLYKEFNKSDAAYFHFHDPELLILAKKIKKKYGDQIKVIYDMHEHIPAAILTKKWIPSVARVLTSKSVSKIEKYYMKFVDSVIFAEVSYKVNYVGLSHVTTTDVLNYPIAPLEKKSRNKNKVFTMIYVGGLTEQRGLFNMLEVAAALRKKNVTDFKLKLIGPLLTNLQKVNDFIKQYQLEENVILLDRIQYDDLWEHYYEAHVGLCLLHPTPNNVNSQSTKLFEYMVAELPILGSDFQSFQEILIDKNCGFMVDPFDYKKAAELILEMKSNESDQIQLGVNGRMAFEQFYNWKQEEKKLVALYRNFEKT